MQSLIQEANPRMLAGRDDPWLTLTGSNVRAADFSKEVTGMGDKVMELVARAIQALRECDGSLADRVIAEDDFIDSMDLKIEEKGTVLLVTGDTLPNQRHLIITAMHVSNTLERIADHAVEIALLARDLSFRSPMTPPETLWEMGEHAKDMVISGLAAFRSTNVRLAYKMCAQDERVDICHTQVISSLMSAVHQAPIFSMQGVFYMFASNHFERIADLATNIGERVIYWRTGRLSKLNV